LDKDTILHITNSYGGTSVFYNLYDNLDRLGVRQKIFVPLNARNRNRVGNHQIEFETEGSELIYSTSLGRHHKYFYWLKVKTMFASLQRAIVDFSDIRLTHASAFCSDGAVAYMLWKKHKIPYIIAVRNTDVNAYYKKLVWHRPFFHRILTNAAKIVFISPSYQHRFLNDILPEKLKNQIVQKAITIPNGVDDVFINNKALKTNNLNPVNIVYAGGIQRNKNIHSVIMAIDNLRQQGLNVTYTIIGRGLKNRRYENSYLALINKYEQSYEWMTVLPSKDKKALQNLYSKYDIFVMPSFRETFGLSYVEALSQGLPVIYTKGEGFDGIFSDGEVGYAVNPYDVDDISNKIRLIIKNYSQLKNRISSLDFCSFSWNRIAKQYHSEYNKIQG
jgi:L-malate glycosyltransferase